MKMKPIPVVKPKPYVEEDDSYLKPGMKDEKEGSRMPKKKPTYGFNETLDANRPKKTMQLPKSFKPIKGFNEGFKDLPDPVKFPSKKNVAPGRSKRDALMGKLKKMGK